MEQHLNKVALHATLHCFTGCAIGEIFGMAVGTYFKWGNAATVVLAVVAAFFFGYLLTLIPLVRHGISFAHALKLALLSDTLSITFMEIVDNVVILMIPGAMNARIDEGFFWVSLGISLVAAFLVLLPINTWLIKRGRGSARIHTDH